MEGGAAGLSLGMTAGAVVDLVDSVLGIIDEAFDGMAYTFWLKHSEN